LWSSRHDGSGGCISGLVLPHAAAGTKNLRMGASALSLLGVVLWQLAELTAMGISFIQTTDVGEWL